MGQGRHTRMSVLHLAGDQGTVMQQLDEHVTTTGTDGRRAIRLMLFGVAMLLTMSAAAALPLILLG